MIKIEHNEQENVLTCHFAAQMDLDASDNVWEGLKNRLDNLLSTQPAQAANADKPAAPLSVVFDLAGVEYINSAFLRICVTTCKQVGQGAMSIVNTSPQIMRIFMIANLTNVMKVS